MKCYYRIDGGEWIKGHVQQLGPTNVHFYPATGPAPGRTFTLHCRPEVLFFDCGLQVTGHLQVDKDKSLYKLVSVDVSPGWVEPK